jgi:opacity protein-like surface antigen
MRTSRFGLATAMLAAAGLAAPVLADEFYAGNGGPALAADPGHCYVRSDIGYSWSATPDVRWTVTDPTTGLFVTDRVTGVSLADAWLIEGGVGCGSGAHGIRGEFVVGYHGKRDIDGTPGPWFGTPPAADPLHTSVETTTLMFNGYYDLVRFDRFTPYVGAGVGLAYNKTGGVSFTGNPALVNVIEGDGRWSLAWSLMAGIGIQISERTTLDLGYRYLDMGKAASGAIDSLGITNPRVRIDDLPPTSSRWACALPSAAASPAAAS